MAQVDPNIAMGFRPVQIPLEESPLNRLRARAEFENSLLKSQEFRQQQNERNALARLMQSPGADTGSEAFLNEVMRVAPSQFEGFATRALQRAELGERAAVRKAEAAKRNRELDKETFQTAVKEIIGYGTVAQIETDINDKEQSGELTTQQANVLRGRLPKTDAELPAWQLSTMRSLLPPEKQLEDIRAERKDEREAARLELEDARVRETQRHQKAMESISGTQAERQLKQLEETQRHNKVMEGLDARRVGISAASEARKAEQGGVELSSKEIQKREAARPQATLAIKSIDAKAGSLIKDLQELRDHPGLNQITGLVLGRTPGVTDEARAAQALYDRIVARGGFQMLQEMREASKTGGALGNVSNQEGKQLQAAFAALDRRQGKEDLQRVIDQVISDVEGAKIRSKEAYDETYSYRSDRTTPAAPAAPAAPKPPAVGTVQDGYRFKGGNPADQKNWEKVK